MAEESRRLDQSRMYGEGPFELPDLLAISMLTDLGPLVLQRCVDIRIPPR